MLVWLALGSSVTLVLVLIFVTKYYRSQQQQQQHCRQSSFYFREKFLRLKGDMNKTVFRDQLTNVDQDKSSSVSGDFENVFPCKEQIEHFLTASRELRKSRENNKYYYSHICLDFFSNKVQKTSSYPHYTALHWVRDWLLIFNLEQILVRMFWRSKESRKVRLCHVKLYSLSQSVKSLSRFF